MQKYFVLWNDHHYKLFIKFVKILPRTEFKTIFRDYYKIELDGTMGATRRCLLLLKLVLIDRIYLVDWINNTFLCKHAARGA